MSDAAEKIDELEPEVETEVTEVPDSVKPVGVNRMGLAAEKRNHYTVYCKIDTNPEHVLDINFWEHVARHLGHGDIVEVLPDDLAWEMSVRVIDCGHNWAHVGKRQFIEYQESDQELPDLESQYAVQWRGVTDRHVVLFKGEVLRTRFASKKLATTYAENHAKAQKR